MNIEYHPALEKEVQEIRGYYNDRVPGLGDQFLTSFESQVLDIAHSPTRWMVLEGGIRRALMRRFPYVIYYRILSENRIRITVVKHAKRHPRLGRERE